MTDPLMMAALTLIGIQTLSVVFSVRLPMDEGKQVDTHHWGLKVEDGRLMHLKAKVTHKGYMKMAEIRTVYDPETKRGTKAVALDIMRHVIDSEYAGKSYTKDELYDALLGLPYKWEINAYTDLGWFEFMLHCQEAIKDMKGQTGKHALISIPNDVWYDGEHFWVASLPAMRKIAKFLNARMNTRSLRCMGRTDLKFSLFVFNRPEDLQHVLTLIKGENVNE